jgi:hypothetical protein
LQAVDAAANHQDYRLNQEDGDEQFPQIVRGRKPMNGDKGQGDGGTDGCGGEEAAAAQLDARVAEQLGIDGDGAHMTSPLEMRE